MTIEHDPVGLPRKQKEVWELWEIFCAGVERDPNSVSTYEVRTLHCNQNNFLRQRMAAETQAAGYKGSILVSVITNAVTFVITALLTWIWAGKH